MKIAHALRSVVVTSGTFAVVRFSISETSGLIEMASEALGTEEAALGHAKFLAPHVTEWTVTVAKREQWNA